MMIFPIMLTTIQKFKQMITPKINFWEHLLINSLNHIESAQSKVDTIVQNNSDIHDELHSALQNIKLYIGTLGDSQDNLDHMVEVVDSLRTEKDNLKMKHQLILESLEMLMFQNQYHEVRQKIGFYKSKSLDDTLVSCLTPNKSLNSSRQTLNRAFLMEQTEGVSENEFLSIASSRVQRQFKEGMEKEQISSALEVISCEKDPFEKKQSAWLGIVYSQNAKEESDVFNSNKILNNISSRTHYEPTQANLTEQFESRSKTKQQELTCSGKKIKSMTLLKDKSHKKRSIPKTSVKKSDHFKERENAENSDQKIMKKKLNFANKLNEKEVKRKMTKASETPILKSFKKPSMHI